MFTLHGINPQIAMMMSDTMFSPSPDWDHQFYPSTGEEPPVSPPPGTAAATGDLTATSGGGTQLSPKSCLSKTVRRRSKASRKTPTTLLNANTTNFRALVQQFTGCPTNHFSFGAQKGPLNLSFGGQDHHYYTTHAETSHYQSSSSSSPTPSVVAPIAYNMYHHQQSSQAHAMAAQQHMHSSSSAPAINHENVKVVGGGLCSLHDYQLLGNDPRNFLMMSTEADRVLNDGYFI